MWPLPSRLGRQWPRIPPLRCLCCLAAAARADAAPAPVPRRSADIILKTGHRIRLTDLASHLADLIPVGARPAPLPRPHLLFAMLPGGAPQGTGGAPEHTAAAAAAGETFGTFFQCKNLSTYLAHNDFFWVNTFAPPGQPGKASDTFVYINKCVPARRRPRPSQPRPGSGRLARAAALQTPDVRSKPRARPLPGCPGCPCLPAAHCRRATHGHVA